MEITHFNPHRHMRPNYYALAVLAVCALFSGFPLVQKALGDDWPTDTTITVTPSLVYTGNPVAFASTTSSAAGQGTVSFYIDTNLVGSARVDSDGTARLAIIICGLGIGTHTAKAMYSGYQLSPGGMAWVTHYTYDSNGRITGSYTS